MKRFLFILCYICIAFPVFSQEEKLAEEYMMQGNFAQAASIYEKIYQKENYSEKYYRKLIDVYKTAQNSAAIEDLAQKQMKRFPSEVWYKIEYGQILEKKGESKAAKKAYDDALKNMPVFPDMVKRAASAFQQAGRLDYAMQAYEKGESASGKNYFALERGELYFSNGQFDLASKTFIDAVKENSKFLNPLKSVLSTYLEDDPQAPFQMSLKTHLLKEAQSNPNDALFNELLYWQFMQQRNFNLAFVQAKAIDKRKNTFGAEVLELGNIARENDDFDMAIQCYEYVVNKGSSFLYYNLAKSELVRTMRSRFDKGYGTSKEDIEKLHNLYENIISELKVQDASAPLVIDFADLMAFYENKAQEGLDLLELLLQSPNISRQNKAEAKMKKADILVFLGDMWEPTLLYGQVEKDLKNDLQGQEAKFRSARLAYFRQEFEFAHDQMKVLKASTSKLFSNDAMWLSHLITDNLGRDSIRAPLQYFSRADLAFYQNQNDLALGILDTLLHFYPEHNIGDEVLYRKAQIYSKMGRYADAVNSLEKVWVKFKEEVLVDDALFMAADLYHFKLNNPEKAMELYEKIMLEHKDSLFVAEARKRYRLLRGDALN